MDALEIERAHLVGHSLGGALAVALAQRQPARVATLTLIGSAGLGAEIDGAYITGFASANSRAALKPQLAKLFGNQELVTRRLVDDVLKYKRLEGVEATLTQLAESLFPTGRQSRIFRDEIGMLPQRVQVIWGEADAIIPMSHARDLPVDVHIIPGPRSHGSIGSRRRRQRAHRTFHLRRLTFSDDGRLGGFLERSRDESSSRRQGVST